MFEELLPRGLRRGVVDFLRGLRGEVDFLRGLRGEVDFLRGLRGVVDFFLPVLDVLRRRFRHFPDVRLRPFVHPGTVRHRFDERLRRRP